MPAIKDILDTLDQMAKIHRTKNDDYSSDENPFYNFDIAEFMMKQCKNDRDKVFACMLGIKFGRLANLLNKKTKPNNESIEDTFVDAAIYSLLWKADYKERPSRERKDAVNAVVRNAE